MTQEEKQLLLKDLSARSSYGVMFDYNNNEPLKVEGIVRNIVYFKGYNYQTEGDECYASITECKPYLRPMSSMTEEEKEEFHKLKQFSVTVVMPNGVSRIKPTYIVDLEDDGDGLNYLYDWLISHHFDFRGLIEKGLALTAPEGMYEH